MTAAEVLTLKVGDRLTLRKWDSLDENIRNGVELEVVRVAKRHYGPVLIARWGEDEVELRCSDYLGCFQHV
jgi:hypothetical protein